MIQNKKMNDYWRFPGQRRWILFLKQVIILNNEEIKAINFTPIFVYFCKYVLCFTRWLILHHFL